MKTKQNTTAKLVEVSETALLSLVAAKLKDRNLFPKKVENAKNICATLSLQHNKAKNFFMKASF